MGSILTFLVLNGTKQRNFHFVQQMLLIIAILNLETDKNIPPSRIRKNVNSLRGESPRFSWKNEILIDLLSSLNCTYLKQNFMLYEFISLDFFSKLNNFGDILKFV